MSVLRWSTAVLMVGLWVGSSAAQPPGGPPMEPRQRWGRLSPDQRRQLIERYQRWQQLSPTERDRLRERFRRLRELPPAEQETLRRRLQAWRRLSPEERRKMQRRLEYWRRLPPRAKERVERALWILKHLLPEEFAAFKEARGAEREERRRRLARRLSALLAEPTDRLRPLAQLPPGAREEAIRGLLHQRPREPAPAPGRRKSRPGRP